MRKKKKALDERRAHHHAHVRIFICYLDLAFLLFEGGELAVVHVTSHSPTFRASQQKFEKNYVMPLTGDAHAHKQIKNGFAIKDNTGDRKGHA